MLERLADILALDPQRIEEVTARAAALPPFLPLVVREDLTWKEVSLIAVNTPDLPGLVLDAGLVREYPEGEVLAHVLGYVGPASEAEQAADPDPLLRMPEFRIGKSGIEQACDNLLRGRLGLSRFEVNALGRELRELDRREPEPGADVELTLDLGPCVRAERPTVISSLAAA
jgi:penicillin-binding protein 2